MDEFKPIYPDTAALLSERPCFVCGTADWKIGAESASAIIRDERFDTLNGPFIYRQAFVCQGCGQVLSFTSGESAPSTDAIQDDAAAGG